MRVAAYKHSGRSLNQKWAVGAKQALYHRDGNWYNNLSKFPGALFDAAGYVVFETRRDYLQCGGVRVTRRTNVPEGICSLPFYRRVQEA